MRGYFGIGVENVSKPMNVGNLFRSAHAFGASFVFTVAAAFDLAEAESDTSEARGQVPVYRFDSIAELRLPEDCRLVGIELDDRAVDLPSFRHPRCAAYVLGQERGGLSAEMIEACEFLIRIPTLFSLNLATAGAIVMYDRMLAFRRFAARPLMPGAEAVPLPPHVFGEPTWRRKHRRVKE
jgi:tRNA G18 (ribose-2'-O)-methylase SpoU